MIFILHYILFNAGLSAVLVFLTLLLQTYSTASLTQVGALLMALPFLATFVKPLFCALADRQQAHKLYLVGALAFMALGYGSLAIAPFFPDFVAQHPRLTWYLNVLFVLVGYSGFGVAWSLGDALAVNAAIANNVSWGSYRVWSVVSWGVFGVFVGQINEVDFLPKYVPAYLVLVCALLIEMGLLLVWPNRHFAMSAGAPDKLAAADSTAAPTTTATTQPPPPADTIGDSFAGGSLRGTARANPRLVGAVATIFMEDLGGTLKSSLKLGGKRRAGLGDLLDRHQVAANGSGGGGGENGAASTPPSSLGRRAGKQQVARLNSGNGAADPAEQSAQKHSSPHSLAGTVGRSALRRAQRALARMDSLSAASGHVICDESRQQQSAGSLEEGAASGAAAQIMYMSSLASGASLSRAAAARALALGGGGGGGSARQASDLQVSPISALSSAAKPQPIQRQEELSLTDCQAEHVACGGAQSSHARADKAEDLQLVLLKLIIRRDRNIWKYLLMFTLFGVLLTLHLSYFFLHLERLCREKQVQFSHVTGAMMAAHSISEVFSFTIVVPYFVPQVGRIGALLTCAIVYAIRFAFYATYLADLTPFAGVPFELCHGIAYGIIYSLITDIAIECVNHVDVYLPELIQRGIVSPTIEPSALKLPLRATMQGVFSGAFDGFGNGLGALFGGLFLDAYSFAHLWQVCTYVCLAIIILYPLSEWRALCNSRRGDAKCEPPPPLSAKA